MNEANSGSTLERMVGGCPEATIVVMGAEVRCLLDTGAQVSTLTESYYRQHLEPNVELVDISSLLMVNSSQGLDVPFIGYVELDANIMGRVFHGLGFLIVRDPTGTPIATRKMEVPGVIGSNIFRDMNAILIKDGTGGKEDCRCDHMWSAVLALYEEQCAINVGRTTCKVRVAGKHSVIVPARSVRIIPGSVTAAAGGQIYYGVVEELESVALPRGLIMSPVYVAVDRQGRIPCSVANLGREDLYLKPKTVLGCMQVVQSTDGIPPDCGKATVSEMSTGREGSASTAEQLLGDMDIGDGLGPEHRRMLVELIDQYSESFSQGEGDLGYCKEVVHHIRTMDDNPIRIPHRRVPPQHWEELRQYLKQWLNVGVLRESSSAYAAPIVIVRKKTGEMRMCVDYRALNAKTSRDAYPLPRIEEALDILRGAKFFCSLDLAHGYYQIPIAKEDIHKTAFRSGTGGLYEFTRMCFGLTGAPATFMRLMDKLSRYACFALGCLTVIHIVTIFI